MEWCCLRKDVYLEHGIKGWIKKVHKYLLRIKEGNKYRYFYTKAEIDAYNKKQQEKEDNNKIATKEEESPSHLHSRDKHIGSTTVTAKKGRKLDIESILSTKLHETQDQLSDEAWNKYAMSVQSATVTGDLIQDAEARLHQLKGRAKNSAQKLLDADKEYHKRKQQVKAGTPITLSDEEYHKYVYLRGMSKEKAYVQIAEDRRDRAYATYYYATTGYHIDDENALLEALYPPELQLVNNS